MMRILAHSRRGFTLVELVLSIALTAVLIGSAVMVTDNVSGSYETSMTVANLDQRGRRVIWEIESRLRGTTALDIDPAPEAPANTSVIEFQRVLRYDNPDTVWGDNERIVLEYEPGEVNDGADNDGDGLADECRIVIVEQPGTPDEWRRVLCSGVSEFQPGETFNLLDDNDNGLDDERGLSFDVTGTRIRVLVALEAQDANGGRIVRTIGRTIAFRAQR